MKKLILFLLILSNGQFLFSQSNSFWQKEASAKNTTVKANKKDINNPDIYSLNIEGLKQAITNVPQRKDSAKKSSIIIAFPNSIGEFENFRIKEASTMHPDLQAKYPNIRSYVGQGVNDASEVIRFSVSPLGLHSMTLSPNNRATFIEPYTEDLTYYRVYDRSQRANIDDDFECEVTYQVNKTLNKGNSTAQKNADDSILRTYRLAVSAAAEYTQYHGGSKALALAAINTTMTRVNGIYESDFNVTLELIANTDDVIYTNTGSDPYGNTTSGYNSQLQSTLTSVIGEANYDIGHLFANLQNNGNAGCIGCVCVNNQKGSGWTSHTVPEGDPFDVDYVAHEMGHQFGGNHTWTHGGNEGTNVQVEPGSGSTIMGYAGITGATDVQVNSDPYFHAVSIEQITDYIKSTSCQTNTNIGNSVPVVNAGSNYTIPNGTAFVLTGSATDANSGDVLSYCWEQMDENNASTTYPSATATTGVSFRSFNPTTDNKRYFPKLETIKTGATSWQWEAVPNVARSLNFRLTVRDNAAGGGTNSSDDMLVTVNGTAGPFVVNTPNTNVTWNAGTTQTVTWDVAGTTGNGINAANVDIFLSTDGGDTYTVALATGVTNDGSHDIVVPDNQGTQNRIMVKGSNSIFFDISNLDFTIAEQVVCNATVPTGLVASNINSDSATLSWDAVPGASYDLEYRQVGSGSWNTLSVNGVSQALSGLSPLTQYEAQVRSKCPDLSTSAYSNIINFTTADVQLNYCSSASTNVNDEYISRVQLNTIDNSSGAQFYSDFTSISTTLTKDTPYTITVTPTWTGTVYNEAYSVWIDYNRDGDFDDSGEQVWTQGNTQATTVSGSFTVPSGAVENSTRMRVSMKYNALPTSCETFQYGEVEDYTIVIESLLDTTAPVITLNGAASIDLNLGETYTELGATANDNVDGDITANIVVAGDTVDTNTAGTYMITYNVSDAAGNPAIEVTRTVNVIADTTAPVITLNGAASINLNVGETYNELGATATDNIDGDITANIAVAGDVVDANTAGIYVVTYNVSDAAGNPATEVTRTVNVIADTTAPVITLNGAATIDLSIGGSYIEEGATATDNIDGDITANIIIGGDAVDTNTAGTYIITYNVTDTAGNPAVEVSRTVTVAPDTIAPVITLIGSSIVDLNVGDIYTEEDATASDDLDGDITANIAIGGDTVDTNIAGTYIVTYNVSDAAGNPADEVIRTVNVIADTTAPVITLIGSSNMNLDLSDIYTEQGATANDNIDGDITANIVIGGDIVDTNTAGTYIITYNVSDAAGNSANEVTRTVTVNPDTTSPVITLIGSSTINLLVSDTYSEQGATASDNIDGDLTASIIIGGDVVSTNTAGTYVITYNVSDAANNSALEVIRTVNVTEPSIGCTGGISSFPYTESFENTLGAWTQSTSDDINWIVDANGTPSNNTGPASASVGTYYIYVEASGNGTGYPNKRAIINSPCFDLGGLTTANFSFDYHMFGAADMGTIDLEISDDDGASWVSIWSQSGNQGNTWLTVNISLNAYLGSGVQLRFNRFVGSTWQADIAIDNVNVTGFGGPDTTPPVITLNGASTIDVEQGNTYIEQGATAIDNFDGDISANIVIGGDIINTSAIGTYMVTYNVSDAAGNNATQVTRTVNVIEPSAGPDILNEGYFETGWDSWTDGGSDCARVSSGNSYEGSYSIRIRDNSGTASAMTLSNIDVTPYSQIEVDFYFYVNSMENNEDFWLRYFDGSVWNTVATWTRGVNINNSTFYNATINITPAQYNFAVNSGFRFQNDASGNNDQIFIDQVTISGLTGSSRGGDRLIALGTYDRPDDNKSELFEEDFMIYPNPVRGETLNVLVSGTDKFDYRIINMIGQTVSIGSSEGQVKVNNLEEGMYFIEVNDGDELMMKKFIKRN